ncbi:MAG TPA: transcriptional regulator, XRE family protein [Oligoflexia bacterium]|nr:transcriptional regulator, XRE family protein [Oligoflexia bacterium]HMR23846.1 transcriptional regulator, XRE family protein [Oligoflexia bacterium]
MNLELLSDQQILKILGERFEDYRRVQQMQDQDIFKRGGVKKDALASFKKGRNISLLNFIKILRGAGLLSHLETMIPENEKFSPINEIENKSKEHPARIHKKKNKKEPTFHWGDEQ